MSKEASTLQPLRGTPQRDVISRDQFLIVTNRNLSSGAVVVAGSVALGIGAVCWGTPPSEGTWCKALQPRPPAPGKSQIPWIFCVSVLVFLWF